jgi:DNA polymerase-3 subunit alpha
MYSLFDGLGTPEDAAKYAVELGLYALAITNHGTAAGLPHHYHACKEAGIIPVLGCEIYFMPEFDKEKYGRGYHMTVLCMNDLGYSNLCQLLTEAADHYYYQPIVTWESLQTYNEGLIITTGCLGAIIPKLICAAYANNEKDNHEAEEWIQSFQKVFGDRFYGEVQPYDTSDGKQSTVNAVIVEFSEKYSFDCIMTTDSHFTKEEDESTHNLMMKMGKKEMDSQTYHNRHMGCGAEMNIAWVELMGYDGTEYLENTDEVADRCLDVNLEHKEVVPSMDWGEDSTQKLIGICKKGLKRVGKYSGPENKVYRDRLSYEINIIKKKHFIDYFLLCYDIYRFARHNGIRCGYGRGSVCGSLLAYAIGITEVDSVKYNIPFETFLREDKDTIPDVDMDFPRSQRERIVSYMLSKYEGKSAQISVYGMYQIKNTLNDLAKVLSIPADKLESLKGHVALTVDDEKTSVSSEGLYDELMEDEFLAEMEDEYGEVITHFSKLYGQVKYIGKHAAGVAISEGPIDAIVPIVHTKNGLQTAYDLEWLGHVGVVKFDFLGLATLDTIDYCEKLIGKKYDIYQIQEDEETLQDFRLGNTSGVFQFGSRQVKQYCIDVVPSSVNDIFALNALNRPGPLEFGYLDKYANRKFLFNNDPVDYANEVGGYEMEIAPDTHGVFLYSDHIIKLCKWAGLSNQETDTLIKAVSKKTIGNYKELADKMHAGLIDRGLTPTEAKEMFKALSLYGFKKAHAVGYGLLSFYAAFLKHHHPLEYFCALLRSEDEEEKMYEYELEARNAGISIMIATVNGMDKYTVVEDSDGDKWIQKGLSSIKGVGSIAGEMIEANKPYESRGDMEAKLPRSKVNKAVYDALDKSGALLFEEKDVQARSIRYNAKLPLFLSIARKSARKY